MLTRFVVVVDLLFLGGEKYFAVIWSPMQQHTHGDKYENRASYMWNAPTLQRHSSKSPSCDPKWAGEKWVAAISLLIEQCGKSDTEC